MHMKTQNSLQNGTVRTLIFKEGKEWFGVALEFNIVETGSDPREVMMLLDEAIRGYIASARKAKLSANVLDQKPSPEYEKLWNAAEKHKAIPSPIAIYSTGTRSLAFA